MTIPMRVKSFLVAALLKCWCRTCRLAVCENEAREIAVRHRYGGCVYVAWHQRMFYFGDYFGSRHITLMISKSNDGDLASAASEYLGFRAVRGSGSRYYRSALIALIREMKSGKHSAGMMADGPQGPPRVLKTGTVMIAKKTGKPIIPVVYGAKRRIVFNSWDRYFLPVPFTKIAVLYGEPIFVPPDADSNACERIRQSVERRLNRMADRCDTMWGGDPVGKPGFDLPAQMF
jgi:lysophospholipid acyltransferase (LPLAT)-like uncharacterized protein